MQLAERTELGTQRELRLSFDSECALWMVNWTEAKCNMPKANCLRGYFFVPPLCIHPVLVNETVFVEGAPVPNPPILTEKPKKIKETTPRTRANIKVETTDMQCGNYKPVAKVPIRFVANKGSPSLHAPSSHRCQSSQFNQLKIRISCLLHL